MEDIWTWLWPFFEALLGRLAGDRISRYLADREGKKIGR